MILQVRHLSSNDVVKSIDGAFFPYPSYEVAQEAIDSICAQSEYEPEDFIIEPYDYERSFDSKIIHTTRAFITAVKHYHLTQKAVLN